MTIAPISVASNFAGLGKGRGANGNAAMGGGLFSVFFNMFNGQMAGANKVGSANTELATLMAERGVQIPQTPELEANPELMQMTVQELTVEIKEVIVELHNSGVNPTGLSDADQLAMAFEKLGMDPDEAREKAGRIMAALDILAAFQSKGPKQDSILPMDFEGGSEQSLETIIKLQQTKVSFTAVQAFSPVDNIVNRIVNNLPLVGQLDGMKVKLNTTTSLTSAEQVSIRNRAGLARMPEGVPTDAELNEQMRLVQASDRPAPRQTAAAQLADDGAPIASQGQQHMADKARDARQKVVERMLNLGQPADEVADEALAKKAEEALRAQRGNAREQAVEAPRVRSTEVAENAALRSGLASAAHDMVQQKAQGDNKGRIRAASSMDGRAAPKAEAAADNSSIDFAALASRKAVYELKPTRDGMSVLTQVMPQDEIAQAIANLNGAADADPIVEDGMEIQNLKPNTQPGAFGKANGLSTPHNIASRVKVAQQVSVQIRQLGENGGGRVRMVLNPPELGEVEIQLKVHDGRVNGAISAQNIDAIEQMARDLRMLEQGLADAGLELDDAGLQFFLNDGSDAENGEGEQRFAESGQSSGSDTELAQNDSSNEQRKSPDTFFDVRA